MFRISVVVAKDRDWSFIRGFTFGGVAVRAGIHSTRPHPVSHSRTRRPRKLCQESCALVCEDRSCVLPLVYMLQAGDGYVHILQGVHPVFPSALTCHITTAARPAALSMSFSITPDWVARLRQDVKGWDEWAEQERENDRRSGTKLWAWPDMTSPLRYTAAEQVSLHRDEAA